MHITENSNSIPNSVAYIQSLYNDLYTSKTHFQCEFNHNSYDVMG